jgi:hypothetical protein
MIRVFPRGLHVRSTHADGFRHRPRGFPMSVFRRLERLIGTFQGLFRMLVFGPVIFFPVVRAGARNACAASSWK